MLHVLRFVALLGTTDWLIWQASELLELQAGQGWSLAYLVLMGIAVAATLLMLLPRATSKLLRNPDLLLPLGLAITALALLTALAGFKPLAAVLTPAWNLQLLVLSFSLSLQLALQVLINLAYAGWTTLLVIQAVAAERVEPLRAWSGAPAWLWRTFVVLVVGWGVIYLLALVILTLGAPVLILALALLALASLVWNLVSFALLPAALSEPNSLRQGLGMGFRLSRRHLGRLAPCIVAQLVLLGWMTYVYVSFGNQTKWNWRVHAFWTGGYENDSRWHGVLMNLLEVEPLKLVNALSAILFAILAIAIKLHVSAVVYPPARLRPDALDAPLPESSDWDSPESQAEG